MTISNESRGRIKKVFEPIALAMGRARPDAERADAHRLRDHRRRARSWSAPRLWVIGGIVVFVGGVFDMFDGTLARATGKASPFGAFMDSMFDQARARASSSSAASPARRTRTSGPSPVLVDRRRHGRRRSWSATPGPSPRASAISLGHRDGRRRHHAARDPARRSSQLGIVLAGASIGQPRHPVRRSGDHRSSAPSSPSSSGSSSPQPGQVGRPPPRPTKGRTETTVATNGKNGKSGATAQPTPGPAPGAGATARSGSPSSASATARAASSRAATTTRTPRRTTSSRA